MILKEGVAGVEVHPRHSRPSVMADGDWHTKLCGRVGAKDSEDAVNKRWVVAKI